MTYFSLETLADKKILVAGDLMLDRYWFGEVDRISPEAPVPIVKVARMEDRLGGAANVARNIVSLNAGCTLAGLIHDDAPGKTIRNLAHNYNIDTCLQETETSPTTLKMRVLGRQQQMLRVDFEESPDAGSVEQLCQKIASIIHTFDALVLSDYAKGALSRVELLISSARQAGVPVFIDPKGLDYKRYHNATVISPNRLEMQQAVGPWKSEDELASKAQQLRRDLNLEALLLTRSEQGMTLYTEDSVLHEHARAKEVFDVSGAGDTVLAALAVARVAGLDWAESINMANKAAGIVVGKLGTSVVTAQELELT